MDMFVYSDTICVLKLSTNEIEMVNTVSTPNLSFVFNIIYMLKATKNRAIQGGVVQEALQSLYYMGS